MGVYSKSHPSAARVRSSEMRADWSLRVHTYVSSWLYITLDRYTDRVLRNIAIESLCLFLRWVLAHVSNVDVDHPLHTPQPPSVIEYARYTLRFLTKSNVQMRSFLIDIHSALRPFFRTTPEDTDFLYGKMPQRRLRQEHPQHTITRR